MDPDEEQYMKSRFDPNVSASALSARLYESGGKPLVKPVRPGGRRRNGRGGGSRTKRPAARSGATSWATARVSHNHPQPHRPHITSTWSTQFPLVSSHQADQKVAETKLPEPTALRPAPVPAHETNTKRRPKVQKSAVKVPTSLKPLLGTTLDIPSVAQDSALVPVVSPRSPMGAQSSELALLDAEHQSTVAVVADEKKQDDKELEDYNKYLKSPFSFIDKVIENPYIDQFVYLKPTGPYELQIVRYDEVDTDHYYTMSKAGVTHFFQGETEFTSLDQWEREYFLYTKMMSIPFFARFRLWKAFYFWRAHIRRQKSNACRKVLQENSYILNRNLRGSLMELRNICYEVSKWRLYRVDPSSPFTLAEFQAAQREEITAVKHKLTQLCSQVRSIVKNVCERDLIDFLVQSGFRKPLHPATVSDVDDLDLGSFDSPFPQRVSHAEKAAIRTKSRKLTKYIRLVDYILVDTLVSLAIQRTQELYETVNRPAVVPSEEEVAAAPEQQNNPSDLISVLRSNLGNEEQKKKGPLIVVDILHQEHSVMGAGFSTSARETASLEFNPQPRSLQQALQTAITEAVETVMSITRLVDDDDTFAQITKMNVDDAEEDQASGVAHLEEQVHREPAYQEVVSQIEVAVDRVFGAAFQYSKRFDKYMVQFCRNQATDLNQFRNASIKEFAALIAKYDAQVEQFNGIPESADIGILYVDSSGLKELYRPSPRRCRDEIRRLLPSVASERTDTLYSTLHDWNEKIATLPDRVEQFVQVVADLEFADKHLDDVDNEYHFVEELYKLMSDHSIRATEEERESFERLTSQKKMMLDSMTFARNSLDENITRFSNDLKDQIPKLVRELENVSRDLNHEMIRDASSHVEDVIGYLQEKNHLLLGLEATAKRFASYQGVLEVPIEDYEELVATTRQEMNTKLNVWQALKDWADIVSSWTDMESTEIQVEDCQAEVTRYKKIYLNARSEWEDNEVVQKLKVHVDEIAQTIPVVVDLRNPNLGKHHFADIDQLLGMDFSQGDWTLGDLLRLNARAKRAETAAISQRASQEAALEEMLQKVEAVWEDAQNPLLLPLKNYKDTFVLGNLDDVFQALDDSLVTINQLLGSRYVEFFRKRVGELNEKLLKFQDTMDEWITCQRSWMYLEAIFGSQDISRQLPNEASMFQKVDKAWKQIMVETNDNPKAIHAGNFPGRKDAFQKYNKELEYIQKLLEDYLETKRNAFPRFYFLSNDELLEILAHSKDPNAVQPHLRKCFDNIKSLKLKGINILAMRSSEGEEVQLGRPTGTADASGNMRRHYTQTRQSVEIWLQQLEKDMQESLYRLMKDGVTSYDRAVRREWVLDNFAQVVMTVSQIYWARGCERALRGDNPIDDLHDYYNIQVQQLSQLTLLVRGTLSKLDRKKVVTLVTTDVHARDVVQQLRDEEVTSITDFNWQKQLRFYWDQTEDESLDRAYDCFVNQSNARFRYGYEYMGVCSRLVITPLTDRCWMTVSSALHLHYGASPAGPAGTGKTESVKDLAKAMGFLCVVFNCSDQIDYLMMHKLFSGLAQTGAWTCLDEFNRIDIEVLSVIAQQLQEVFRALAQQRRHFVFQGSPIDLKPGFGVMITMNPGYAGRTELPDNLKVLFRPVAMMIPDYALIAEIMLFAEGFDTAQGLSKKMVKLYKLSSEQLSQQDHYDFGMRAVKSVLVMAGALKRAQPHLSEDVVLMRAMQESNVPKFLDDDLPLFNAIVNDLFPGVEIPPQEHGKLEEGILQTLADMSLQPEPSFILKVEQLFDTFNVRFGVMLVGPTGGGKSTCYRTLAQTMTSLHQGGAEDERYANVHLHVLNPKSITMGELYGEIDPVSRDWTDGLASDMMRQAMRDNTSDRHWIVFDGPVDALWIENMNTVLDDNMTLCLSNGERIKLKHELRMLFEVEDLAVASPATVSRCGMVYMTPTGLGYMPFVLSWLPRLPAEFPQEMKDLFVSLVKTYVAAGLKFIRENCKEPVATVDINLVQSLCVIFESLVKQDHGIKWQEVKLEDQKPIVEMAFSYAYVWSVGGALSEDTQEAFSDFAGRQLVDLKVNPRVYDYYADMKYRRWVLWKDITPEFKYDPQLPFFQMLVPTMDTMRYSSLAQTDIAVNRNCFFTGVTGVGKSAMIADVLKQLKDESKVLPVPMSFSAQTNARKTQLAIEGKLTKLRKDLLGAPPGKKVVVFIDDVNMPVLEEYGAQPPIELLRQLVDLKFFYDRKKRFRKQIQDTTVVCAAAPPGGGRSVLTPRFTRQFHVLCMPSPSTDTMNYIFKSLLEGYLSHPSSEFKPDIVKMSGAIVKSSVELYQDIVKELKPTPAKSHYTFNLRDLSSVVQGICSTGSKAVNKPETMVRLWVHESQRCFYDRLIDENDRDWFKQKAVSLVTRNFKLSWSKDDMFGVPIVFAHFLRPGDHIYEEAKSVEKIQQVLTNAMEDYNEMAEAHALDDSASSHKLDLVFFEDAVLHICRIARILRQPRGNALLVGVGGSGKQSLTRLACHLVECAFMPLEISRDFGYANFQEHLKVIMTEAGVKGKQVAFLFTENQILQERFLEDINSILNSGEVNDLWAPDEKAKIIEDLTPAVRAMGKPESRDVVYETFVQRVRDNLHIVLCMSPVGSSFRLRTRKFPSLINCTTLDWFDRWPREALLSVSRSNLRQVELPSDEIREALCHLCVDVHMTLEETCERYFNQFRRHVYATPKSFLDLISLYLKLLQRKRGELTFNRDRLTKGLTKLVETREEVTKLEQKMHELKPQLELKTEQTKKLIADLQVQSKVADKEQQIVSKETAIVSAQEAEVKAATEDATRDLEKAKPALLEAFKALGALNKADISEIKKLQRPPPGVQLVLEAVCIMLQEKPEWSVAQKVMSGSKGDFLKLLQDYDTNNVASSVVRKLQTEKYLKNPKFTPTEMAKVSTAATSLCRWVCAVVTYSRVKKLVEPKEAKVAELQEQLTSKQAALKEKTDKLDALTNKVNRLRRTHDDAQDEKRRLEEEQQRTQERLHRADKLTSALANEEVRWQQEASSLKEAIRLLVGNVFLAAACVSYYGPFSGSYRKQLLEQWTKLARKAEVIPMSDDFSLRQTLGEPLEIHRWISAGLPTDSVSIDSGILVQQSDRWPLMIDPQGQAKKWVRNLYSNPNYKLQVTRLSDRKMLETIESGIRTGLPVLIEDVGEELDASLDPILLKQIVTQDAGAAGQMMMIQLGDKTLNYDPHFKLFMTTKLSNPHFLPEVGIKVNVLNFTVTQQGLEDQLLGDVVMKEQREIEEKRNSLTAEISSYKKHLRETEESILKQLSESTGMLLDNIRLIDNLNKSKADSEWINQRVADHMEKAVQNDKIRERYRSVAKRGSILYFVISSLAATDPMYQYSLTYFKSLFEKSIDAAQQSDSIEERVHNIIDYLTFNVYSNICRGLFEAHKSLFSFLICTSILKADEEISEVEWNLLIRGTVGLDMSNAAPNPHPDFIRDSTWQTICGLDMAVADLQGIASHIKEYPQEWCQYYKNENPHQATLPAPFDQVKPFQRLLILKAFRFEKLMFAFSDFVAENLGAQYVGNKTVDLEEVYRDTDFKTPIIFILSQGADPTSIIHRFAEDRLKDSKDDKFTEISLGQGQGAKASKAIEQAQKEGAWVLLQNCHLAKSWMPELGKICEAMTDPSVDKSLFHPDFRLWLTSMPCDYFPVTVLQSGVKITNEPPKGLKANLGRSYNNPAVVDSSHAFFEECKQPEAFKKLLFGLCFFHATIQERKMFGPLGWNKMYEFNDSDLKTAIQVLRMFLDEQDQIPWDALHYVVGQITYGGRVTDDWDRRCLLNILEGFLTPDILQDNYAFSESGIYKAPPEGKFAAYLEYIDSLPGNADPEIFGMHENATISFQMQESEKLVSSVLAIQPRAVGGGAGRSSDDIVYDLAEDIQKNLPDLLDKKDASPELCELTSFGVLDSLATVLFQEVERFNKLLSVMQSSLTSLKAAIRGEMVMSPELDKMYSSFLDNSVPDLWAKSAYPSLKPLASWVEDLHQRVQFMGDWLTKGEPTAFWLPGFFYPQGFCTGTLQRFARKYQVPIDTLSFSFKILNVYSKDEIKRKPEDGVYIYGLYADGMRWNDQEECVDDSKLGDLHPLLPVIHLVPTPNYRRNVHNFECPIYKTSVRAGVLSTTGQSTNFVLAVDLPSPKRSPHYWVLKGAAILCQLDT